MPHESVPSAPPALRLNAAELAVLLDLRPTAASDVSRTGLGVPQDADLQAGREELTERGLWQERYGRGLPAGEAIAVGDVLTAATTWVRIGTDRGAAATLVVGPDRVLLSAPLADGVHEFAGLAAEASVAGTAAEICVHLRGLLTEPLSVHVVHLDALDARSDEVIATGQSDAPELTDQLARALGQAA